MLGLQHHWPSAALKLHYGKQVVTVHSHTQRIFDHLIFCIFVCLCVYVCHFLLDQCGLLKKPYPLVPTVTWDSLNWSGDQDQSQVLWHYQVLMQPKHNILASLNTPTPIQCGCHITFSSLAPNNSAMVKKRNFIDEVADSQPANKRQRTLRVPTSH